jgi:hypothetical protein
MVPGPGAGKTRSERHCEPTGRANARPMTGSAKQSIAQQGSKLDCFAALAMTARCESAFSPRVFARGLPKTFRSPERGHRECRALDAPAAWWAEWDRIATPVVVTTVTPETPGIPRAMVYSLLRALPGEPGLFATVISGISSTDLIPASGRQDHTTSPSALGAFVSGTLRVHRIPARAVDVAQRPSVWDGMTAI